MLKPKSFQVSPPGGWNYVHPETGRETKSFSHNDFEKKVHQYRQTMGLDLSAEFWDKLYEEICLTKKMDCDDPSNPQPYESAVKRHGRNLWKMLHEYTLDYPDDPTDEQRDDAVNWVMKWNDMIPNYGCACKSKWIPYYLENPPDVSSKTSFVLWAVNAHNHINIKLGKPIYQLP